MALIEEAHKAARILLDHAYVRILARDEPDASCAAALLAHALRRENVDFHVSWVPRVDADVLAALADEKPDCVVLLGLCGDLDAAVASARRIVIDRCASRLDADATLDPRHAQESDPVVSISGLAHLVGVAISKRNRDLAPLALCGAIGQWRHVGGLRGLDAEILAEALEEGLIEQPPALALHGPTLLTALAQLDAPYVAGITGRARNVKKLIGDLRLSADAPPSAVRGAEAEKLGSFLTLRLLAQKAPDAALDALFRPGWRALQGPHTGLDLAELARAVEAACALGRGGLAFSLLWPEPAAGAESLDVQRELREELVAALLRAERDAKHEGALLVADAPRAGLCGPLADRVAMSLAPAGSVALARHAEGDALHLALRAFSLDKDLGRALQKAAAATGGSAHGDKSSGRARIPLAEEGRFVKALAETLA